VARPARGTDVDTRRSRRRARRDLRQGSDSCRLRTQTRCASPTRASPRSRIDEGIRPPPPPPPPKIADAYPTNDRDSRCGLARRVPERAPRRRRPAVRAITVPPAVDLSCRLSDGHRVKKHNKAFRGQRSRSSSRSTGAGGRAAPVELDGDAAIGPQQVGRPRPKALVAHAVSFDASPDTARAKSAARGLLTWRRDSGASP